MTTLFGMLAVTSWTAWLARQFEPMLQAADGSPARLGWATPLPGWGWTAVGLMSAGVALWSYRGRLGPRWARTVLATLRTLSLVAVVILLAGPQRVEPDERVEPDHVYLLIDRSASMQAADGPRDAALTLTHTPVPPPRLTRDAQLRRLLTDAAPRLTGMPYLRDRRLVAWTFSDQTQPLALDRLTDLPPAEGLGTDMEAALRTVLDRTHSVPLAGVLLLTDGRSPQGISQALVRQIQQRGVGIYPLAFGQVEPPGDVGVSRVEAPDRAFLSDRVPVTVWLSRDPTTNEGGSDFNTNHHTNPDAAHDTFTLRLVEVATGRVLDERTLTTADFDQPQRLEARGAVAGPTRWRVELEAPAEMDELTTEDNQAVVTVELIDRPLRVLYVDGQPRWAYRYLKNFLVRTTGVEAAVLLASAEPDFVQEGARALARFPGTADELDAFDVLVLGDVPPTYFGPTHMRLIRDQVATRGLGLLWIGGPRFTPTAYAGASLEDLLPMRQPGEVMDLTRPTQPVALRATPAADRLGLLRLGSPESARLRDSLPARVPEPAMDLDDLPPLYYAQNLGALKPVVDVLATGARHGMHDLNDVTGEGGSAASATPAAPTASAASLAPSVMDDRRSSPLLTQMRYGSGLVMYLATDDVWRWRFGAGGLYDERLYAQLLQVLARHGIQHGSMTAAAFDVAHRQLRGGQTTLLRLRVRDPLLAEAVGPQVTVDVYDLPDQAGSPAELSNGPLDPLDPIEPPNPKDPNDPNDSPPSVAAMREQVTLARVNRQIDRQNGDGTARRLDAVKGEVTYEALWQVDDATRSGRRLLRVSEPALAGLPLSQEIHVIAAGDERRDLRADHALLRQLAAASGGVFAKAETVETAETAGKTQRTKTAEANRPVPAPDSPQPAAAIEVAPKNALMQLARVIPRRAQRQAIDRRLPLWDRPAILILLLTLLTLEWAGRKILRLP